MPDGKQQLKIVVVGHVDHGKSTLIGRLFYDTNSLPDGKFETIKRDCERRGMQFEWAFLMDALKAERDQNITIETSHAWFRTAKRDYVLIDAPGHHEFLKNMVSGAAQADAAIMLIDVVEGIKEQSKRHGYLLKLLGIKNVIVAVNKMDACNYDSAAFHKAETEYTSYLREIGITAICFIPISAREGDNIAIKSTGMSWHSGYTLLDALDSIAQPLQPTESKLRMTVQDVYRFDNRRIIAGKIESGKLTVGDELLFLPANRTAKVASIEAWNEAPPKFVSAGDSVGITLDEQIFVERGDVVSHVLSAPVLSNTFSAALFWLGHEPLVMGKLYIFRIGTAQVRGEVVRIKRVIDTTNLGNHSADSVASGEAAEIIVKLKSLSSLDDFQTHPTMGRFVIVDGYDIAGGGIISLTDVKDMRSKQSISTKSTNTFSEEQKISPQQRAVANGHLGGVLWLTGLSGSGKSTLAQELEQRLFAKGIQAYVLDGDNIRKGLSSDLDFTPAARAENIRRVAEVATLFAGAGMIAITAFISPYNEDRIKARNIAHKYFHLVHVKCGLETCEARDTKGLYKKARAGEIKDFTGVNAPYEEPDNADLVIDTSTTSVENCVSQIMEYIERNFIKPVSI